MPVKSHYRGLAIMTALSFLAMYVLMYAMVNSFENVYSNLNQFYMAGLMAAAMVLIEVSIMWSMYHDRTWNIAILIVSVVALIGCWLLIRKQTGIADEQFLKSMIPHHASAILMCHEAPLSDAEIKELCRNIVSSQDAEIRQMKAILERLDK
jgi:uncharacterized protein (DUF305 family)